jgi:peroxiredoxin family protein
VSALPSRKDEAGDDPMAALKAQLAEVSTRVGALEQRPAGSDNRVSLLVFSNSLDRVMGSFMLATTSAALGMEVQMLFTFWGMAVLRDAGKKARRKTWLNRMFGWMLPRGSRRLPLSQMNMGGMGSAMMRRVMSSRKIATLEEMMALAAELGVTVIACEQSMRVMGLGMEELIDYPGMVPGGLTSFLERAAEGKVMLFI